MIGWGMRIGIAGLAGLAILLAIQSGRLARAQSALRLEQALHATDIANFKAAQAMADARHLAAIDQLKTGFRRMQDEADHTSAELRTDYDARVLRIPAAPADPRGAERAALPGAGAAARADRSGGDTILLARADALICAANIARL